jgi:predicted TIM-barrel fold metal-dependent hydrolase
MFELPSGVVDAWINPEAGYANTRGQDRVMFASDYPLLTHERCLREARALPFRDAGHFAKFVAANAGALFFGA